MDLVNNAAAGVMNKVNQMKPSSELPLKPDDPNSLPPRLPTITSDMPDWARTKS